MSFKSGLGTIFAMRKITVIGAGYVGLSLAVILAEKNKVTLLDIDDEKVLLINKRISPIKEEELENALKNQHLSLEATTNKNNAIKYSDIVIICAPTNYDPVKNSFDTSIIEKLISDIFSINEESYIVIKSTIPIGFTRKINQKYDTNKVIFSPEFLREGSSIRDNINPSRIVIGSKGLYAEDFSKILLGCIRNKKDEINVNFTGSDEAESIKLFSNSYLAMRVAFFNELDSFCHNNNLDSEQVIKSLSLDKRIGNYYNNPSFGYGGYCLPKDTKQLDSTFKDVRNPLIRSITKSNNERKKYIANAILNLKPNIVGINRLAMKKNSDNFRESAIFDVMKNLANENINIIIYEPILDSQKFEGFKIDNNLESFLQTADVIITNRRDSYLKPVVHKVFTRDIFNID